MDWLKNMMFGSLGGPADPNQPDPYGGQYNKKAAMLYALGNMGQGLGYGLMTRDWKNALAVSNADADGYQNQAMKKAAAARLMEEADAKKQERARAEEERKKRDDFISQFPADVQMKMRSIPGYMEKYIGATDPAFQQAPEMTADMQNFQFAQENPEFAGFLQQGKGGEGGDNKSYAPIPFKKPDGTVGYGIPYAGGKFVEVPAPEGSSFLGPFDKAADAAAGKIQGEAEAILPAAVIEAKTVYQKAQRIIDDKNLDNAVGYDYWRPDALVPNDVITLRSRIDELLGGAFLQGVVLLQGTGPLTEKEGAAAASSLSRMERAMKSSNPQDFKDALRDYSIAVNTGVEKLAGKARQPTPDLPVPDAGGEWQTLPNGVRIRQKGP